MTIKLPVITGLDSAIRAQKQLTVFYIPNIDFPKKEMYTFYEVKVWLEPEISVAKVINLSEKEVNKILEIVKSRKEEIDEFWKKHFS